MAIVWPANYNKLGRPAVVFVKDGHARVVIKKESYENMLDLECNEDINV